MSCVQHVNKAEEETTEHVSNCTAYSRALRSKVQADITRESRLSKLKETAVLQMS